MTKRAFYTLFTLGWLGAMPLWAQQVPELVAEQGYADLVLVNGKIVSMDDRSTRPDTPGQNYQSMAIKGKRIMALGNNQEMRTLAGPATRFLDVGGRTVIPGLIQTHHHTFLFADLRYGPEMGLLDPSIRLTVATEATAEANGQKGTGRHHQRHPCPEHSGRKMDSSQSTGIGKGSSRPQSYLAVSGPAQQETAGGSHRETPGYGLQHDSRDH